VIVAAASADKAAATSFIPEFQKMVEQEGYSPKHVFNVNDKLYYTKCQINFIVVCSFTYKHTSAHIGVYIVYITMHVMGVKKV
jgi:hypothetical protein